MQVAGTGHPPLPIATSDRYETVGRGLRLLPAAESPLASRDARHTVETRVMEHSAGSKGSASPRSSRPDPSAPQDLARRPLAVDGQPVDTETRRHPHRHRILDTPEPGEHLPAVCVRRANHGRVDHHHLRHQALVLIMPASTLPGDHCSRVSGTCAERDNDGPARGGDHRIG